MIDKSNEKIILFCLRLGDTKCANWSIKR